MAERSLESMDKIHHLNKSGVDHFMKTLVKNRTDLTGLPWAMGDDCRLEKTRSTALVREVKFLRNAMRLPKGEVAPEGAETKIDPGSLAEGAGFVIRRCPEKNITLGGFA